MFEKKLILIVGAGRSGTTLLRNILDLHPGIGVVPELRFFDLALANSRIIGDLSNKEYRKLFIERVISKFQKSNDFLWKKINFDKKKVIRELMECNSVQLVYLKLAELCSTKPNSKWIVDKIPNFFIGKALNLFPDAKIIHIVRDGREYCASARKRGDWADSLINIAVFWLESLRQYKKFHKKYNGKNFLEIKYEKLVNDPDKTIMDLYNFLGLSVDENLFSKLKTLNSTSSFKEWNKKGIYKSKNFDSFFDDKDQRIINTILKKELKSYKYLQPNEKLKKLFNLKLGLNIVYEKAKIQLYFFSKKKGIYWLYRKLRKFR